MDDRSPSGRTRLQAAWFLTCRSQQLGRVSGKQRIRMLAKLAHHAQHDPDSSVRKLAVYAFMCWGGWPPVTRMLVDCARNDPEPEVRAQALEALAHRCYRVLGDPRSGSAPPDEIRTRAGGLGGRPIGFSDMVVGQEARDAIANLHRNSWC